MDEKDIGPLGSASWFNQLDPREIEQIAHAWGYARTHAKAGIPGHGQFLLIAKLARLLNEREAH